MTDAEEKVNVAKNLTARIKQANVSIYRLRQVTKLTWDTIKASQTGYRRPTNETLEKLAQGLTALGVPTTPADLLA